VPTWCGVVPATVAATNAPICTKTALSKLRQAYPPVPEAEEGEIAQPAETSAAAAASVNTNCQHNVDPGAEATSPTAAQVTTYKLIALDGTCASCCKQRYVLVSAMSQALQLIGSCCGSSLPQRNGLLDLP
jgi:hypothetical protein